MNRRSVPVVRGHLNVRDLTVSYQGVPALRRAAFACGPGEIVGVLGPNGAGKSTLLKAILGIVPADGGDVRIDDEPVDAVRSRLAYLPQRAEIDWDYPAVVEEVVAMGRYPHLGRFRRFGSGDRALVGEALSRLGLSQLAGCPIGELSGGQQQRTMLARALAQQARVLLLDEPFAGVDAVTEQLVWQQLHQLRDEGITMLVVNHDLARVSMAYDQLLLLSRRMVAFGPTPDVFTPERLAEAYGRTPGVVAPVVDAASREGRRASPGAGRHGS